jgi:hypothetical protein
VQAGVSSNVSAAIVNLAANVNVSAVRETGANGNVVHFLPSGRYIRGIQRVGGVAGHGPVIVESSKNDKNVANQVAVGFGHIAWVWHAILPSRPSELQSGRREIEEHFLRSNDASRRSIGYVPKGWSTAGRWTVAWSGWPQGPGWETWSVLWLGP